MKLLFFLILLLSFSATATVYQKQSVESQIKESTGIIYGHFLKKRYVEMENGEIATQMIFKMDKEIGIDSEIFQSEEVIVHYPGGRIGQREVYVEGLPQFVSGEKAVVFIKNHKGRFWGLNLSLGVYKVVTYGQQPILINSVFPEDLEMGQISWFAFERLVKELKNLDFKKVSYIVEPVRTSRAPASIASDAENSRSIAHIASQSENNEMPNHISTFWLIVIFGVMGTLFTLARTSKK